MSRKFTFLFILALTALPLHNSFASNHAKSLSTLQSMDIMFAQMMIPHHQQALEISGYALKNTTHPEIRNLAREIISAQKGEISQMKYWLKVKKASMGMGHEMHMDGVLSDKEVNALKNLKGKEFNSLFLKSMIKHHEGALQMVSMISDSKNVEARALARDIVFAQKFEIARMKKILTLVK